MNGTRFFIVFFAQRSAGVYITLHCDGGGGGKVQTGLIGQRKFLVNGNELLFRLDGRLSLFFIFFFYEVSKLI